MKTSSVYDIGQKRVARYFSPMKNCNITSYETALAVYFEHHGLSSILKTQQTRQHDILCFTYLLIFFGQVVESKTKTSCFLVGELVSGYTHWIELRFFLNLDSRRLTYRRPFAVFQHQNDIIHFHFSCEVACL